MSMTWKTTLVRPLAVFLTFAFVISGLQFGSSNDNQTQSFGFYLPLAHADSGGSGGGGSGGGGDDGDRGSESNLGSSKLDPKTKRKINDLLRKRKAPKRKSRKTAQKIANIDRLLKEGNRKIALVNTRLQGIIFIMVQVAREAKKNVGRSAVNNALMSVVILAEKKANQQIAAMKAVMKNAKRRRDFLVALGR